MAVPAPVERLIESLRRLPGIGEKSATRLAFYLLSAPQTMAFATLSVSELLRAYTSRSERYNLFWHIKPFRVFGRSNREPPLYSFGNRRRL